MRRYGIGLFVHTQMRILKRRMKLKKNFHTGGYCEMRGGCGNLCTFFFIFFIRILTYENCNIFDIFTGAISISACLLMNFLYVILAYETSNIFDIFKRTNFNLSMSVNELIRLVSLFEIALLIIHLLRLIFISFIRV